MPMIPETEAVVMMEPPPLAMQVRQGVLHPEPDALEVDGDDAVERLLRAVDDGAFAAANARVVVHDVELAERVDGGADERAHVFGAGDVGSDELAGVADARGYGFALLALHIADDDAGAFAHEQLRGGFAHAARPAGDDRDLAFEPSHTRPPSEGCIVDW